MHVRHSEYISNVCDIHFNYISKTLAIWVQIRLKQKLKINSAVPNSCSHIMRTILHFVHPKTYSMVWELVRAAPG